MKTLFLFFFFFSFSFTPYKLIKPSFATAYWLRISLSTVLLVSRLSSSEVLCCVVLFGCFWTDKSDNLGQRSWFWCWFSSARYHWVCQFRPNWDVINRCLLSKKWPLLRITTWTCAYNLNTINCSTISANYIFFTSAANSHLCWWCC